MSVTYFKAIHNIITIGHSITDQVHRALKPYGLSEPQYNVLRTLDEAQGKPVTVSHILDNMVQPSSNVTRIVDKLLEKGLATRKECPINRRKMDISLTRQGKIELKKLDKVVQKLHKKQMDNLTEKELKKLIALLKKLK